MSLTSLSFLVFLLAVIVIYYVMPKRIRWIALLLSSLVFYYLHSKMLLIWILFASATIYCCGLLLERQDKQYQQKLETTPEMDRDQKKELKKKTSHQKNVFLWITALLNIFVWFYFKYTDILISAINSVFSRSFNLLNLAMPIGISFYTLQAIGYIIDVSHGKCSAQRNYCKLLLWLSFFPQIIQGPICRYSDTAEQLITPHDFDYRSFKFGAQRMLFGYFKKMVIADRAVIIVTSVFGNTTNEPVGGSVVLIGILAYMIQIYGDFSGGIDIICGVAEMLGIRMPENFSRPYFSRDIAEYWRRWHITLGTWFRDYVFYPLSISKAFTSLGKKIRKVSKSKQVRMIPTFLAMSILWILHGVWHVGIQYIAFGVYQGILIILGMMTKPHTDRLLDKWKIRTDCFSWRHFQMFRTFILIMFGRMLYRAPSLSAAFHMIGSMFRDFNPYFLTDGTIFSLGVDEHGMLILCIAIAVLFVISILQERGVKIRETLERQNLIFRWLVYLAAIFVIILAGAYGPGYDAAAFVYEAF